jgi:hypothetical protein
VNSHHHHHHYPGVGQNHHHSSFLQHHNTDAQQCLPTVATALQQMHADKMGEWENKSDCNHTNIFTQNFN